MHRAREHSALHRAVEVIDARFDDVRDAERRLLNQRVELALGVVVEASYCPCPSAYPGSPSNVHRFSVLMKSTPSRSKLPSNVIKS